jgi:hypothetical protein
MVNIVKEWLFPTPKPEPKPDPRLEKTTKFVRPVKPSPKTEEE